MEKEGETTLVRVILGERGAYRMAAECPDRPLKVNGKPYWRTVGDLISKEIKRGEEKYGKDATSIGEKTASKDSLLLRGENPSGSDDGNEVRLDDSTGTDGHGSPEQVQ